MHARHRVPVQLCAAILGLAGCAAPSAPTAQLHPVDVPPAASTTSTSSTTPASSTDAAPASPPQPQQQPNASPPALRIGVRCGIGPGDPVAVPEPWPQESATCRALDRKWAAVTRAERACRVDSDCVVVPGTCETWAIATSAAGKYGEAPCEQPMPRTCSRPASHPSCENGCCVTKF